MVKIKKSYPDPTHPGRFIEVEGTESEVEAFERKQQKQKATIEETTRKKTILYGRDLEEIRRIVREEIAALPPRIEYRYYPNYLSPPWWTPAVIPMVQPLLPTIQPTWTIGPGSPDFSSGQITCTGATGSATSWITTQNTDGPVGVYSSNNTLIDVGGGSSGWGRQNSAGFLMSPVGVGG